MRKYREDHLAFHHKFDNGFECAVDKDGIIWYKRSPNAQFESPCMKACYYTIEYQNHRVAKYVLSLACEIQDDECITARASGYKDYYLDSEE